MQAAAEASTVTPWRARTRARRSPAVGVAVQRSSAYVGLPGPENTQSAPAAPVATSTSRPTLRAKYRRARAEMSAAFS
ncbi:hypothetical protein [Nonomuraea guangzhouensis]|uniref:Uncharacterized protein n=1 Tax=Nonomuraea guangzhouensis TaxID=1291555 RepID=A0ABW4GA55_9ACTN